MGGVTCSGEAALDVSGGVDLRPRPKAGVPMSVARNGRCVTSDFCVHFGNIGMQIQVYSPVTIPSQASGQGAACPVIGKGVTPLRKRLFLSLIAQ
jgi:hypothetical protein